MTDIERTHNVGAYVLAFVASIFVNYALAWLISRLNATNAVAGLKIALACWFAFLFVEYATISVFSAFETNPWPLVCIDMGRPLLGFAISGLVLGGWRKPV
jgi:UDP-N-acetylmuramyl pentapeptide phosphotransferase/UDP-N-acetylglucosamine-1-phosphate transferase